jgi:ribonuclease HII
VPRRAYQLDPEVSAATAKLRFLKQLVCSDAPEQALRYHGYRSIAGVDEVGRGALFGPVVAAAVILPVRIDSLAHAGLKDSKQLDRKQREKLDRRIRKRALAISIAAVDAETIDRINIYQATRLAMLIAVRGLALAPDHLLIDAVRIDLSGLAHDCQQTPLFYGDSLSLSIAAASVVAKVHRDRLMRELDEVHPGYGLASHKGYATPEHRRSLRELGPCPLHRKTFAPVRALLPEEALPETAPLFDDDPDAADPNDFLDDPLIADALAEPSLDELLHRTAAI